MTIASRRAPRAALAALLLVWRRRRSPAPAAADPARGPVTNLPLPRFVSMRAESANARRGPSLDQRVDWEFVRRGLPLEITAEYGQWRRVRDADGAGGWVHHALLSGRRARRWCGARRRCRSAPGRPRRRRSGRWPSRAWSAGSRPAATTGARSRPAGSRDGCRGRRSGAWARTRTRRLSGNAGRGLICKEFCRLECFARCGRRGCGGDAMGFRRRGGCGARCLCGAVRYQVADAFEYAVMCHCSRCRKATGSAFKPAGRDPGGAAAAGRRGRQPADRR